MTQTSGKYLKRGRLTLRPTPGEAGEEAMQPQTARIVAAIWTDSLGTYQARCADCTWRGPWRRREPLAVDDAKVHRGAEVNMLEWTVMPRGTLRLTLNERIADVWRVGGGWRWTVERGGLSVEFLGHGMESSQDEACEAALRVLEQI